MNRRKFLELSSMGAGSVVMGNAAFGMGDEEAEFARHKIEEVITGKVQLKYPRLVGKNARLGLHGYGPEVDIVELVTNQGARGWGVLREREKFDAAKGFIKGKAVGEVFKRQAGVIEEAVLPFDFALHDLAGVILDKPVYELISGNKEPVLTNFYSGMIYFDDLEPEGKPAGIDAVLKNCQWDYEYGYRQFKVKLGRGNKWMPPAEGLKRDIEVTKAIAALFPDCDILVDANDGFSVETTVNYLNGIEGIPLFWIEEAFRENVQGYEELAAWMRANGRANTYIADGEANPDLPLALELGEKKLLQVYLQDMTEIGFTAWRKLNMELKKKEILSSPHCWGDMFKTYYTSHLIAAQGNAPTIEGVTCFCDEVDFGEYQLKGKSLIPSREPGFGMKLKKKLE